MPAKNRSGMRHEFVRFLIVGVINTIFSYLLYLLLLTILTYLFAYSVAYCSSIVLSYFLNAQFVFKKGINIASFLKFPIVYAIQYALGAILLWLLVGKADIAPELAMIGVIIVTTPVTFLTSRFILKH